MGAGFVGEFGADGFDGAGASADVAWDVVGGCEVVVVVGAAVDDGDEVVGGVGSGFAADVADAAVSSEDAGDGDGAPAA